MSVTRLLPEEGGEPQYRIRIDVGGQERVVRESQLASTQTARAAEGLPGPVKKGTPLMAGSGRRGP
ncbi:hypothetical protein [Nitrospirillum iridis]|uniref:hypothetical protein n=1 Tax=Nitrospirillum iridis TaxID=765888 RepID=UPI001B3BA89C|nr:hypothetical protein [Nitrospirillum iridis]